MAVVELILDVKSPSFLTGNTGVPKSGEPIYLSDGRYSYGDGITQFKDLVLFGGGGVYTAGSGLQLIGNQFSFASNNISQFTNDSGYITSSALSGYVPYTGATSGLDLGTNTLTTTGLSSLSEIRIAHGSIANQGIVLRSQVGTAANGAIYMAVTPSATNHSIVYDAVNNQTRVNGTGGVVLSHNNNSRMIVNSANMAFVLGGGAADLVAYNFTVPTASNSTLNEAPGFRVIGTSGKNFPTGTVSLQRESLFTSPTFSFTGASNLTMAANLSAEYVLGGTNANIITGAAIYVRTKAVTNTVTSYGLLIEASTGATNNIAAGFVGNVVISGSTSTPISQKSANYTFLDTDDVVEATAGTWNLTLPTAVGRAGQWKRFANNGSGVITLLTTSGETVNGAPSGSILFNPAANASFVSNGTNWVMFD